MTPIESFKQYAPESTIYSAPDWASLFMFCTIAAETGDNSAVRKWIEEYAAVNNFTPPDEPDNTGEAWSDSEYIVKEAMSYLGKFAENWHDQAKSNI